MTVAGGSTGGTQENMERHPITAILLTCSTCGLVRMADDYGSAHARGNAHIRLSGHSKITYRQIEAPERIKTN
jgi:hypothetical protein